MIFKIPAKNRFFQDHGWLKSHWLFSFSNYHDAANMQFGPLRVFNDDTILPHSGFPDHPHDTMEIITIMLEGELTHSDSMGNRALIRHGEIQRMSAGTGIVHSEYNKSDSMIHLYQLWFYPNQKTKTGHEQKAMDWHAYGLVPLSSKRAAKYAVTLRSDASLFLLHLSEGQELPHRIQAGTGLFVYGIEGSFCIGNNLYVAGDQARIREEKQVMFRAPTECRAIVISVLLK